MIKQSVFFNHIIWGISAFSLGVGVIRLFSPEPMRLDFNVPEGTEPSTISRLFGDKSVSPKNLNEHDIQVLGFIAGDTRATALVSISRGVPRSLTTGVIEKDGWTLERVEAGSITVNHYGARIVLPAQPPNTGLPLAP